MISRFRPPRGTRRLLRPKTGVTQHSDPMLVALLTKEPCIHAIKRKFVMEDFDGKYHLYEILTGPRKFSQLVRRSRLK